MKKNTKKAKVKNDNKKTAVKKISTSTVQENIGFVNRGIMADEFKALFLNEDGTERKPKKFSVPKFKEAELDTRLYTEKFSSSYGAWKSSDFVAELHDERFSPLQRGHKLQLRIYVQRGKRLDEKNPPAKIYSRPILVNCFVIGGLNMDKNGSADNATYNDQTEYCFLLTDKKKIIEFHRAQKAFDIVKVY